MLAQKTQEPATTRRISFKEEASEFFEHLPARGHFGAIINQRTLAEGIELPPERGGAEQFLRGAATGEFRNGEDIEVKLIPVQAAGRRIRAGLADGRVEERSQKWK